MEGNSQAGPAVILGAGPAGLTAAYELSKSGVRSIVLEASDVVGGLAQTVEYKGYLFDIGGHRFFTKVSLVDQMWRDVLGDDFIKRPRMSRIYYNSIFFHYPLVPMNALAGLGIFESAHCGLSYVAAQVFPRKPEDNFEDWVINRFGRRLYEVFFKTYTEKVWGIPCREIGAEWAAQRIKGLSLLSAVWNAIRPQKADKQSAIKTLIHEFEYPRRGPGMMWQKTRTLIEQSGSKVEFQRPVEKVFWEPGRVLGVEAGGQRYEGSHYISTIAIHDLLRALDPAPPANVRAAADDFHYRDFLTVAVMVRGRDLFPDNWIYVHDPNVAVGRIQNYGNWSPEMVPDSTTSCLGMEYFCFEGDRLWTTPDAELFDLAKRELALLGLVRAEDIFDGTVVRMRKAYPVYDSVYERGLRTLREFLPTLPNLQLVGRNGMHRYNNQDHSMLTAILAARNILGSRYDLWSVNADTEYHEQGGAITEADLAAMESTQPLVPTRIQS